MAILTWIELEKYRAILGYADREIQYWNAE